MPVPVTNVLLEAESAAIGYIYVAFAMVIFYDYALGIAEEIELFWPCCSMGSGVFCKYLDGLNHQCEATYIIFYIANVSLFATTAAFAALRVYALSNRNIGAGICVLCVGLCPILINLYMTIRQSHMYIGVDGLCAATRFYSFQTEYFCEHYVPLRIFHPADIRAQLTLVAVGIVVFASTVLTDLIVVIVTWRRTYKIWLEELRSLGRSSPLVSLLLSNGLLYFAAIMVLNTLDLAIMCVWVNSSSSDEAYTSFVLVPLSAILINHFLADLRGLSKRNQYESDYSEVGLTSPGASGPFMLSLDDCQSIGVERRFECKTSSSYAPAAPKVVQP